MPGSTRGCCPGSDTLTPRASSEGGGFLSPTAHEVWTLEGPLPKLGWGRRGGGQPV